MSGLASRATLLLYDGSPFVDRGRILWELADTENMTHFGTSAKLIDALIKLKVQPKVTHKLHALRAVLSDAGIRSTVRCPAPHRADVLVFVEDADRARSLASLFPSAE